MKLLISVLLFYTLVNHPMLNTGSYNSTSTRKTRNKQELFINKNGTFSRTYYDVNKNTGSSKKRISGIWEQRACFLVLIDTTVYPASMKPTFKQMYGIDDSVIVTRTKYVIEKHNRLSFLWSKVGKIELKTTLPNFRFVDSIEH
jgi:hypothetical protein